MIRQLDVRTGRLGLELVQCRVIVVENDCWSLGELAICIQKYFLFNAVEEYLWLACYDDSYCLIGIFEVSHGALQQTLVSSRAILQRCLLCNAFYFRLIHNHPSKELNPSREDYEVTAYTNGLGLKLGMKLVDHVIISDTEWSTIKF